MRPCSLEALQASIEASTERLTAYVAGREAAHSTRQAANKSMKEDFVSLRLSASQSLMATGSKRAAYLESIKPPPEPEPEPVLEADEVTDEVA